MDVVIAEAQCLDIHLLPAAARRTVSHVMADFYIACVRTAVTCPRHGPQPDHTTLSLSLTTLAAGLDADCGCKTLSAFADPKALPSPVVSESAGPEIDCHT